ncbi:helix-turn-helix domain-containing protein [Streptomyces pseudogriseolus]|nr:helix-turn-helix domain-containing protein [Streptomyces sp. SID2955]
MRTAIPSEQPQALMVPEVMTALRLSRSKVYDLIRSKELPSYTSGRARRIPVEAVRAYMQNRLEENAA